MQSSVLLRVGYVYRYTLVSHQRVGWCTPNHHNFTTPLSCMSVYQCGLTCVVCCVSCQIRALESQVQDLTSRILEARGGGDISKALVCVCVCVCVCACVRGYVCVHVCAHTQYPRMHTQSARADSAVTQHKSMRTNAHALIYRCTCSTVLCCCANNGCCTIKASGELF